MRKKMWIFTLCLVAIASSGGIGDLLGQNKARTPDFEYFQFHKKDGQIHSGVAIPDNLLSGDFDKDCQTARSFLSPHKQWIYVISGNVPGLSGHTGFGFRALACDELVFVGQ